MDHAELGDLHSLLINKKGTFNKNRPDALNMQQFVLASEQIAQALLYLVSSGCLKLGIF